MNKEVKLLSEEQKYLKVVEYCSIMNVSKATVYRGINDGSIQHKKVKGGVRIPKSETEMPKDETINIFGHDIIRRRRGNSNVVHKTT